MAGHKVYLAATNTFAANGPLAMEISLNTPALLFPAISLILLAYTNRFMTLAKLIRDLHARWRENHDHEIARQVTNLRLRIRLIRDMQGFGISSMLGCVLCMFLIFLDYNLAAIWVFGSSMALLLVSLGLSLVEIWISTRALQLELADMEENTNPLSFLRHLGTRKGKKQDTVTIAGPPKPYKPIDPDQPPEYAG